jgi:hypothetical protein
MSKRFGGQRSQSETRAAYHVVSVELKDGRRFDQAVVSEGCIIDRQEPHVSRGVVDDVAPRLVRRPDFVEYVSRVGRGTKMPRLRTEDALIALFPLPPLAEQYRIVAKVDELMAVCDRSGAAQRAREAQRHRLKTRNLRVRL